MRALARIFQRFEQQRTKSSAIRIGALEEMTFKDTNEKILREILGVGNGMAAPAGEGEDRPPISFAKLVQCFARRFFASA